MFNNKFKVISLLICLLSTNGLFAQTEFSSLEEKMTGTEFDNSGLNKLSAEELSLLNKWLQEHSVVKYDKAATASSDHKGSSHFANSDKPGYAQADANYSNHETIQAKLLGNINGWNDSSVFRLDNGMVWEMDEKDSFYIKEVINPEVEVRPGMFNTWKLLIVGYSSTTRVKRIQ